MNKIVIFLLSIMIFSACKSMNEDNESTIRDPQKEQQQKRDSKEKKKAFRLEYKMGKERILKDYLEKTKNNSTKRQIKQEKLKKRMQENEKHQRIQMEFRELEEAAREEFDAAKKRKYKTQWSAITALMKAYDSVLKVQEIPFNSRKKLITEAVIEQIVKYK